MPGEGSIFRMKSGSWRAQISIGPRSDRQFRTRTVATRREAVEALDELRAEHRRGMVPSKQSLGEYLRWWLDETVGSTVSANTRRGYQDAIAHLQPLAGVPLKQLTEEMLEHAYNRMTVRRGKVAHPAAPKTIRNVQSVLRTALQVATDRGRVPRNVARFVKLHKVPRYNVKALTVDKAKAILDAIAGDRYEAALSLGFVGMRQAEILGLRWEDVDFDHGVITIRYQLVGSGPRATLAETKTADSAAPVRIPPFVVERLVDHRTRQIAERPVAPMDGGMVFVTERGYAVNGSWLTKHFQQLLKVAGLPRMRFHDLRHGTATLLVDAGVHPRVAQEVLRHAPGSKVTMARYAHVTAARATEAVDVLERLLGSQSPSQSRQTAYGGEEEGGMVPVEGESGSGGRIRTYDQAVNSRASGGVP